MENSQPITTISVSFEVSCCLFTLLLVLMSHLYPLLVPRSYKIFIRNI